jgi:hypothetical protein
VEPHRASDTWVIRSTRPETKIAVAVTRTYSSGYRVRPPGRPAHNPQVRRRRPSPPSCLSPNGLLLPVPHRLPGSADQASTTWRPPALARSHAGHPAEHLGSAQRTPALPGTKSHPRVDRNCAPVDARGSAMTVPHAIHGTTPAAAGRPPPDARPVPHAATVPAGCRTGLMTPAALWPGRDPRVPGLGSAPHAKPERAPRGPCPWPSVESRRLHQPRDQPGRRPLYVRGHRNVSTRSDTPRYTA